MQLTLLDQLPEQTAMSNSNDGLNSDDVSEDASICGCRVSGSERQLSDVNVLGDFDNGMCFT